MQTLAFDRVVLSDAGTQKELDLESFLTLPLHMRVRYVLGRQIEFFAGAQLVDRRVALDSLRRRQGMAA